MGHCESCPLAEGASCPSALHPRYCDLAARGGVWPGKIREKAAELAGRPAPPRLPGGFPRTGPAPGKVRLGFVFPVMYAAGAEYQTLAIARGLDPGKVALRGLVVTGGESVRDPGMTARFAGHLPVADGVDAALALARECDVLIVWDIRELAARLKRSRPGLVVVAVSHSPGCEWGRKSLAFTDGVDRLVAVSELALAPIPGASREKASVIWNCVDPSRLESSRSRTAMRESWGVPPGAKVLGYYGRMSPEKRPGAVPRALAGLPHDWHAVIVGAGWTREQVELEAAELGVSGRLHLPGPDPAAGDVLGAFDVLLVPSEFESFGLTLAEGLWLGVPVVSTPVGIAGLHPGLTREVPVDADGPTLAAAVLTAHDPERIARARSFARERLDPARFGKEWTDLVLSLAPGPSPAPAPTPGVARDTRLSVLRNACPRGSRPGGCGCSDELNCSRLGRRAGRAECFACLELEGIAPGP